MLCNIVAPFLLRYIEVDKIDGITTDLLMETEEVVLKALQGYHIMAFRWSLRIDSP